MNCDMKTPYAGTNGMQSRMKEMQQEPDLDPDWVKAVCFVRRIHNLKHYMNDRSKSVFKDVETAKCFFSLYKKHVVVLADKPLTIFCYVKPIILNA